MNRGVGDQEGPNRRGSNRKCGVGLSGTVHVAEQFPGALSAATPRRAGLTAKWSRLQTRTSLKVAVKLMGAGHTEWIGNEKSASRLVSAVRSAIWCPVH